MLIKKDVSRDMNVTHVLLTNDRSYNLDENQFFQWTPTGKRLELWEGKKEFLNNVDYGLKRVCYWNHRSVIAFYW